MPEVPEQGGQSNLQMAGLVSARFRSGMRPLAIGTALVVALSAPLADFLLERHDLGERAEQHVGAVVARLANTNALDPPRDQQILRVLDAEQRGADEVAQVSLLDHGGKPIAEVRSPNPGWPLVSREQRTGDFIVRVALGEHESLERDLLLLGVFGALGLVLGLALYFFPLRLFREEDLVLLFARRSIKAAEDERLRLSRDLHDGIGQILGTCAVAIARLTARTGRSPEASDASSLIDRALDELRSVALGLRPTTLDDLGLGASISALARDAEGAGLEAEVEIEPLPRLSRELEQTCFRLAQEALSNIVRHAQAKKFSLSLGQRGDNIVLEVADDGRGFSPSGGMGLGLVGARERAAGVAGTFQVESAPGRGTRLRAVLPVQRDE